MDIEKGRPPRLQDGVNPRRRAHRGPHLVPIRGPDGLRPAIAGRRIHEKAVLLRI